MNTENDGLTSQERKMLTFVSEKYTGDRFTFYKSYGGSGNAYNCFLRSEKYPDDLVDVTLVEKKSGDSLVENYMHVKYAKEIRETTERILTECYGNDYFLMCRTNGKVSPENATSDTTFAEFAADPENTLSFRAIIRYDLEEEGKEKSWEDLKEALVKEGISYSSGDLIFETDKDPASLNVENYGPYLYKKTYDGELEFEMAGPGVFTRNEWEK